MLTPSRLDLVLLAAAVAIVLSTGNTFLLVPSTNVSRDLYQRFVDTEASEPRMLLVQRLSIAAFGVLALLLITQFDTILAMALYAYSLVGASLTPALMAAFLWRRVTVAGGVACALAGLLGVFLATNLVLRLTAGLPRSAAIVVIEWSWRVLVLAAGCLLVALGTHLASGPFGYDLFGELASYLEMF